MMIFQNKTRARESLPLFAPGFLFSEQAEANAAHLHLKSHSSEQAEANAALPYKNPAVNEQVRSAAGSPIGYQSSIFVRNFGPSLVTTTVCSFWAT
ncbi:hypothetical protein SAAL107622_12080 [Lacicoccus alkaliphilus]|uniref:Uncharacterized protein n=1 Tax=Lacicoccus alkaliphilus DSM 16010 TaxID=1123231 RepID=A0A1M7K927_9BACL|nr:hypothetical protein SAMN02745189_02479 [Salinicoccus alkaliphilus DSM 16010]